MRIAGLWIDGFGVFRDARLDDVPPGLVVLFGENEAGKSTLLGFVRSMLFGFPRRNSNERQYPPLVGGREGGRLTLELDAGERWAIERLRDEKARLVAPDGCSEVVEPAARLLPGVTRELFSNIHAFGLDELQEIGSLDAEAVRTAIFGAATGGSVANLPRTYQALGREATDLFTPRGMKPPLNALFAELDSVRKRMPEVRSEAAEYDRIAVEREQVEAVLVVWQQRRRDAETALAEIERRGRAWPEWVKLIGNEARLEGFGAEDAAFPESGVERLVLLEDRRRERRDRVRAAERSVGDSERVHASFVFDARLVGLAARVGELAERRSGYDTARTSLVADEAGLEAADREARAALARLGPDWTIERVRSADRSMFARSEIAEHEAVLGSARGALDRAEEAVVARRGDCERSETELAVLTAQKGGATADVAVRRRLSRSMRQRLAELETVRSASTSVANTASDNVSQALTTLFIVIGILLGAVAITVAYLLFGKGDHANAATIGGAGGLMAVVLVAMGLMLRSRGSSGAGAAAEALAKRERDARSALAGDAARAGIDGEVTASRLDAFDEATDAASARATEMVRMRAELERLHASLEDSLAAVERSARAAAAADAAWSRWLGDRGLPRALTPATARDALDALERVETQLREADRLRREIARERMLMSGFANETVALVDELGRDRARAAADPSAVVHALATELDRDRRNAAVAVQSAQRVRYERAKVDTARADLGACENEIAELFAIAGAEDEEDFRRRGRLVAERATIVAEIASIESRLNVLTGAGRDALEPLFADASQDAFDRERATAKLEVDAASGECERLERDRAELGARLAQLASADHVATLRLEEERLLERIRQMAGEWSRVTVARYLLDEAKRRFEASSQPEVLREAARFFRTITAGRYTNVIAPLDGGQIEVVDVDGRRKKATELSRGALEQLYLAIRFGYIATSRSGAEKLPIVMDDILVNSDAARAGAAAAAIVEMARDRQVLYFTCHRETVALFGREAPAAAVIDLEGGRIRRRVSESTLFP